MALTTVRPEGLGFVNGRRNLIINGAMQVAQRGTQVTGLGGSNDVFAALDRIKYFVGNTAGRFTAEQVAVTDLPGFANAMKLSCTTADTSIAADEFLGFKHMIEGQDLQQLKKGTSEAESTTLSFYVKGNAAAEYTVEIRDIDNDRINTQTFNVTTSWTRVEMTFAPDTTGTYDDDNAMSIQMSWWLHAGSTYSGGTFASNSWASRVQGNRVKSSNSSFFDSTSRTLFVTGIQYEVGTNASDFEHRSFGEELSTCQRYTYVFNSQKIGGEKSLCNLAKWDNGTAYGSFSFPMEMRTAPSATIYNKTEFYVYIAGSVGQVSGSDTFGVANQTTDIGEVYIECGEGSSGQAGFMRKAGSASGTSSGYIVLDAEL